MAYDDKDTFDKDDDDCNFEPVGVFLERSTKGDKVLFYIFASIWGWPTILAIWLFPEAKTFFDNAAMWTLGVLQILWVIVLFGLQVVCLFHIFGIVP